MKSLSEKLRALFSRGNLLHADAYDYAYYHDETIDGEFKTFTPSFLSDTVVTGAWLSGTEGVDRSRIPATRTILVDSPAEYASAFVKVPAGHEYDLEYVFSAFDVDFEREFIVIYTEQSLDGDLSVVKKSSLEDGVLKIELDKEKPKKIRGVKNEEDGEQKPFQRYVIIRLDRVDCKRIEITKSETV